MSFFTLSIMFPITYSHNKISIEVTPFRLLYVPEFAVSMYPSLTDLEIVPLFPTEYAIPLFEYITPY